MRARVLITLLLAATVCCHRCNHDEKQRRVVGGFTRSEDAYGGGLAAQRRLQSVEHQMRIHVEYGRSDNWILNNPTLISKYNFSKRLLDTSKRYFEQLLKVKGPSTLVLDQPFSCNDVKIPSFKLEIDLYVLVDAMNKPETSAFATAFSCYYDKTNNRPTIGVYDLNLAHIVNSKMNYLLYFSTFIHEFTHIIFFSENLFSKFRKPDGSPRPEAEVVLKGTNFINEKRNLIVMSEVVDYARTFFNDQTLTGVPLENGGGEGSAGSHWEKSFMPLEFMNPSVEFIGIVSEFTLRFMQGTGWYSVNYDLAQSYEWGKGHQDYHGSACPTSKEYCTAAGEAGCSSDYISKTTCAGYENFMGNCKYKKNSGKYCPKDVPDENKPDALEKYGAGSRCVMLGAVPKCATASCDESNQVKFQLGKGEAVCATNGQKVDFEGTQVTCPENLADFCAKLNGCPDDCSGFGVCLVKKTCFCIEGFNGPNCGNRTLPEPSTELPKKSNYVGSSNVFLLHTAFALAGLITSIL
jgi:leishmanolysin